jgi:hypothetical protein
MEDQYSNLELEEEVTTEILDITPVVIESPSLASDFGIRLPHFRTLNADSKPLSPYELEDNSGDYYHTRPVGQCDICKSHFKKLAEQAYIHYAKRPWRVVKFFETYYGVTLTHESIRRHMEHHCDFKNIQKPGLITYGISTPEVEMWLFREKQLNITILLLEIDHLKMLADQCNNDKDLRLRFSNQIIKATVTLNNFVKERDSETKSLKIGDFIAHIKNALEKLKDDESKKIMIDSILEFQRMLQGTPTMRA